MKLFDFHKPWWCGGKTDGLSQVEIRAKTAFLFAFRHICQASRLWHSGKKEKTKATFSNPGDPRAPIKAEVSKI